MKVLNGMGLGLFSTLIVGLIIRQIGTYAGVEMLVTLGGTAQLMMGPGIAAAVAHSVNAPPLVLFSSLVVGAIGAGTFANGLPAIGEPVGAAVAALIGALMGKLVHERSSSSINILLIPFSTIVAGGITGITVAPYVAALMKGIGAVVNITTTLHPIIMGAGVSVVMGVVLTLPISSAALAISLDLSGLAAGAATIGCSCQMIGFAVSSYRENGFGGLISQGIGTSMIQVPNIIRNPWIWVPPTLASALLGSVGTVFFKMENSSVGAGMGTSGLVGQVGTLTVMGEAAWPGIFLLHFAGPAALAFLFSEIMRKRGLISAGDMKLNIK